MAKGKKTGGRDFEPGQSGNPDGRASLPEDLKRARSINRIEFERILNEYLNFRIEELESKLSDPSTRAIELIIAKVILENIKRGDPARMTFLFERLVGRPPNYSAPDKHNIYER